MARSTTTSARRGPELPLAPGTGSISGACVIGVIIDDAAAGPVPRIVGSGTGSGRPPGPCGHSGALRIENVAGQPRRILRSLAGREIVLGVGGPREWAATLASPPAWDTASGS